MVPYPTSLAGKYLPRKTTSSAKSWRLFSGHCESTMEKLLGNIEEGTQAGASLGNYKSTPIITTFVLSRTWSFKYWLPDCAELEECLYLPIISACPMMSWKNMGVQRYGEIIMVSAGKNILINCQLAEPTRQWLMQWCLLITLFIWLTMLIHWSLLRVLKH